MEEALNLSSDRILNDDDDDDDNPSGRTMALRSTQPLTELSTRNIFCGIKATVHRTDNLTTFP